jgi:hypothetical protein
VDRVAPIIRASDTLKTTDSAIRNAGEWMYRMPGFTRPRHLFLSIEPLWTGMIQRGNDQGWKRLSFESKSLFLSVGLAMGKKDLCFLFAENASIGSFTR